MTRLNEIRGRVVVCPLKMYGEDISYLLDLIERMKKFMHGFGQKQGLVYLVEEYIQLLKELE